MPAVSTRSATPLQDGRFLLLGAEGRGGMATVFRAFDRVEQGLVAVKVASEEARSGPAHPLAAEFESCSRLDHPNVVRVRELATSRSGPLRPGAAYLVMDFVGGGVVHRALSPGTVACATVERLALQLLSALDHVHRAGLVHRDLKPANVLVDRGDGDERFKLTDFGLACPMGSRERPGTITGSLHYVAPESVLGLPVDARSDLYGLGILLYQLATGTLPATGDAEGVLRWHLTGESVDPRFLRPALSPRLARFIHRLTAHRPGDRPASAAAARALLGAAPAPVTTPAEDPHGRRRRVRVRLALDAARLGERRVLRLEEDAPQLERELRVWTEVRGLLYQRIDASRCEDGLVRLVLRLLIERGRGATRLARRHALHRHLPVGFVRGVPVRDDTRETVRADQGAAAEGVARFLLHASERRTAVLHVLGHGRADADDGLWPAVLRALERETRRAPGPRPGRGGLLILATGLGRTTRAG